MTRIGVVGASARAAVHSLARAGHSAWAVDQFADRDLKLVAECVLCPPDRYPDAIPALAAQFPRGLVLYTGGLENHPHIVAALAAHHELWGNPPDVLERVRNPHVFFAACGVTAPRLVPSGEACPTEGRWLRKPLKSGGGLGIRFARPGEPGSPHHYFQEFIDGVPMSALYAGTTLLGVTEQLIGEKWLHAAPFAYCGNVGPVGVPVGDVLQRLGRVLVDSFGLSGVFGVDFVLTEGTPYLVEVNPRYTAAVEVLEFATGEPPPPGPPSLKGRGEDALCNSPPSSAREWFFTPLPFREGGPGGGGSPVGKAIYYAPHAIRFPQCGPWDADLAPPFDPWRLPTFADIPDAGAAIGAGHPVFTFFATGSAPAEVRERLQSRAAALDHLFAEHHQ